MLTEEHIKEGLSRAFVSACANRAGMNCEINGREYDYGFDGTFIDVRVMENGRRSETGFKIDFQLKSTINLTINETEVIYSLDSKNYNDLVEVNVGTPRILVLFYLPSDSNDWLSINEERLELKKCAWWCSLKGQEPTSNVSTVNIHIPKSQMLNVEEIGKLMSLVKGGEEF
ncbi:DUF4365 domain-containing protein [Oceanobacillus kimchii]|uniref:DUF4365 domain-containing protein n=1 Tax=Oceanobacillus kimchii TaxID=746691 RepID=UPI0021A83844|nr:DUF4365 domain-containing protein [Oceanobacillus kimchii]MCT1577048.1 DUF4365 domain-containing protein [Oceanobacillus kimchii]MCT2135118.1 DUF4365 domain-containing protein [Oceanobacillus kimchii]